MPKHDLDSIEKMLQEYVGKLDCPRRRRHEAVKRIVDVVVAFSLLLVLTPLLVLLAAAIRLDSPGRAFYTQRRLGRFGKPFTLLKLRTMYNGAPMIQASDGSAEVFEGDGRITRLGKVMRRLGLDELPQLINVLFGDMSLIGPRPDLDIHLNYYSRSDLRKLAMLPGITSLAQVSGRNSLPWKERIEYEIQYVENFSLWLDLKIAWWTLVVISKGIGVYSKNSETKADQDIEITRNLKRMAGRNGGREKGKARVHV